MSGTSVAASERDRPKAGWLAFILLGGIALRLIGIAHPPIGMHSWRQADTAAVARNYHENGYRFLFPQADWGGSGPGYVESEFPLYTYATALLYRLGGVREVFPRLLSVLAYVFCALALYRLVLNAIDRGTGLWAAGFFSFLPLNIFYSRAIMPESWMITASVCGVFFLFRWTRTGRAIDAVLSAGFTALAVLLKLPALYLGLPLAYLAWQRFRWGALRKPLVWLYAGSVLIPVGLWYWHAHRLIGLGGVTYGIWGYGTDKWGNWGLVTSIAFWNGILFKSIAERWLTWAGMPLFLAGVVIARNRPGERLFDWWLAAILVYFLIVARGNFVHEYYQLPLAPVAAVFMAKVCARFLKVASPRPILVGLSLALIGIAILGGSRYVEYMHKEDPARTPTAIVGHAVERLTPRKSLIVTLEGGSPALLYMSHRKGWVLSPQQLDPDTLERLRSSGARYLVGTGPVPQEVGVPERGGRPLLLNGHGYIMALL